MSPSTATARSIEAQALAERLSRKGAKAHVIKADLADRREVEGLIGAAERAVGKLRLLVNNAAIFEEDDVRTLDAERFDRQLAVNLRAPLILSRDFANRALASRAQRSSTFSISAC